MGTYCSQTTAGPLAPAQPWSQAQDWLGMQTGSPLLPGGWHSNAGYSLPQSWLSNKQLTPPTVTTSEVGHQEAGMYGTKGTSTWPCHSDPAGTPTLCLGTQPRASGYQGPGSKAGLMKDLLCAEHCAQSFVCHLI